MFEDEGDVGQDFHNPYERVKLDAETSMRAAGDRFGIDVRIFRPSAVVGPAPETAGGQPSNLFFIFIRMMEALARLSHRFEVTYASKQRPRLASISFQWSMWHRRWLPWLNTPMGPARRFIWWSRMPQRKRRCWP